MKASPKAVQQELWVSFVGLLRSYVAAHEIGRRNPQKVEIREAEAGHQVTIRSGARTLVVNDGSGGVGRWTLSVDAAPVPQQGSFVLREDGTVEFSDRKGALDLEVAAEALTSRVLDDE